MPPRVSVEGLSKAFQLRRRNKFKGISTDFAATLGYVLRRTVLTGRDKLTPRRGSKDFLYALDNVSFEVLPGEVLGIIGRNGAGKSTLLKILARVLDPTEGRVTIRGRVVSLLELGLGFAPELTVRENVQIYGRLAGIRPGRIVAVEDEILSLARLTKFRDLPLASCPSGSFVQLAFAAMISLDADVILADEVLTVGDSDFRRTCEQRILDAGRSGESVLFVSHDMNAIRRCCSRVLWIDKGQVRRIGAPDEVIEAYATEVLAGRHLEPRAADIDAGCRVLDLRLADSKGSQVGALDITSAARIDCILRIDRPDIAVTVEIALWDGAVHIFTCTTSAPIRAAEPATYRAGIRIPAHFFNERSYQARCRAHVHRLAEPTAGPIAAGEQKLEFSVMNPHPEQSVWADWRWGRRGVISPRLEWTLAPQEKTTQAESLTL